MSLSSDSEDEEENSTGVDLTASETPQQTAERSAKMNYATYSMACRHDIGAVTTFEVTTAFGGSCRLKRFPTEYEYVIMVTGTMDMIKATFGNEEGFAVTTGRDKI